MEHENAGHSGNDKSRMPDGLIKQAVGAPITGLDKGAVREGIHTAPESFSEPVPFESSPIDIVMVLTDGQVRHYPHDAGGIVAFSYFFESYPKKVFSFHFGSSCHYVKGGKVAAMLRMSREQFFEYMLSAFKQQLIGMKPEPVEQQVLWGVPC